MLTLFFDKLGLMRCAVGGQGAEDVHALGKSGYINVRLSGLQNTLAVEGADLHFGKLVGCLDMQDRIDKVTRLFLVL